MKRLLLIFLFLVALALSATPAEASSSTSASASLPLCLPGVYLQTPEDCLPLGPSAYLTEMAQSGVSLPPKELPAKAPDPSLTEMVYDYGRVYGEKPVFPSLENAKTGSAATRFFIPGYDFASYTEMVEVDGVEYFKVSDSEWMRGLNPIPPASQFQGLELLTTPERKFGWILKDLNPLTVPSYTPMRYSDVEYKRYDIVQVYDIDVVNGQEWYLIGPDQWVDPYQVALVYPAAEPPAGVENGRWIEINLLEQTVSVYEDNRLIYATLVSTGLPGTDTRPGLFQVYEIHEATPMGGAYGFDGSDYYYLESVPWTMYFDARRALHGAYWHDRFGYKTSHGCANLSPGDSHWIFDWAEKGDWVYVWDPSNQTPTDPDLYSAGGA